MTTINLSLTERLTLANQFKILAALNPSEADDYRELITIAERGFSREYGRLFFELNHEGLTDEQCEYVSQVLDMFWNLQDSYDQLADKAGLKESDVSFRGFDGNNEGAFIAYAKFCLKEGFDRFRHNPGLNSHCPTTSRYRKILARYKATPVERRRELSSEEIRSILEI